MGHGGDFEETMRVKREREKGASGCGGEVVVVGFGGRGEEEADGEGGEEEIR